MLIEKTLCCSDMRVLLFRLPFFLFCRSVQQDHSNSVTLTFADAVQSMIKFLKLPKGFPFPFQRLKPLMILVLSTHLGDHHKRTFEFVLKRFIAVSYELIVGTPTVLPLILPNRPLRPPNYLNECQVR